MNNSTIFGLQYVCIPGAILCLKL